MVKIVKVHTGIGKTSATKLVAMINGAVAIFKKSPQDVDEGNQLDELQVIALHPADIQARELFLYNRPYILTNCSISPL